MIDEQATKTPSSGLAGGMRRRAVGVSSENLTASRPLFDAAPLPLLVQPRINENSYQSTWPLKIFFFCQVAAAAGGETPIADCRRVFAAIDPAVRARFIEKGWMYVRNFGDGFGLDWRTVFQTDDKAAVEAHCRKNDIELEWKPGNRLQGDVLLLDNMMVAHGRAPYSGDRKILVGMAEPVTRSGARPGAVAAP